MKMLATTEASELQEHNPEIRREAATKRSHHETRPYVVRDLSWELARFLDSEDFSQNASATAGGSNGNPTQTR